MKKCPYCGHMNEDTAKGCERCYAGFPTAEKKAEAKQEEQPKRVDRKNNKE